MARDWYRQTAWSSEIESEFFVRLKRSRSVFAKAQYLHIQAANLVELGTEAEIRTAVRLLRLVVDEYYTRTEMAITWDTLAECHDRLDEPELAVQAYQEAFKAMEVMPNVKTNSALNFAEFCVRRNKTDLFKEALRRVEEYGEDGLFPALTFRSNTLMAILHNALGRTSTAARHRTVALKAAQATRSNAQNHPKLGLVGNREKWLLDRLNELPPA